MKSIARPGLTSILTACAAAMLCAVPVLAETIDIAGHTETGISLQSQGTDGVEIGFQMARFGMEPLNLKGETAYTITLPGVFLPNNAGAPDLPGMGRYVAMPQGATASFEIVSAHTQVYHNVEVAPAPVIPRESDNSPLVYQKDLAIYSRDAFYPESPVMLSEPGMLRGVDVVTLGITPFLYNPVSKELIVYTELDVRVSFHGGTGHFGEDRLRSRYWEPILGSQLLNYDSLSKIDMRTPDPDSREGWEYVIITPDHPDFIAWGDTLKAWRKLQGITTECFTTTEIGGTSWTAIESFLNNAYHTWDPAPVAFLILGDYPGSGDNRDSGVTSPTWNGYCVSDNIYADIDGDDLPEMAHARITARNAGELQIMIEKMLTYERAPYTDEGFYDHPVIAGGWQTERWFILCTEIVLGYQVNILGKDPVREYAIHSGTPGSIWSSNPNTYMLLDYFGPSGLGYIPATPAHLTDWGGNATRLNNDINAGAYMVMHRDHGGVTGWGEPYYNIGHLSGLSNDMYPFVFSINCLTGKYNSSSECFTEAFHRMNHGALGVIAASDISYSFVNDTFIFGMCDGLWPDFMPGYPYMAPDPGMPTDLRPSFAMINGKHFLYQSNWPYNPQNKDETYHLFHTHSDAFLTMYTEMPQYLTVIHDGVCFTDVDLFTIQADLGSIIALTVEGEIIGVAEGTGTPIDIPIIPQSEPGTLKITVTKANYFRHDEDIPILPPEGPYLVIDAVNIDDDMNGLSAGNGDGDCDAGEQMEVNISLRNVGSEDAINVRATLETDDEHCEILDDYAEYGDIAAGATEPGLDDFFMKISPQCPDGHQMHFIMNVESDNRMTWEKHFTLAVEAPIMLLSDWIVDDTVGGNGDGRIDPGETFTLEVTLGNEGSEDATNVQVYLVVSHPDATILQGTATVATLAAGGTATPDTPFEVTVDLSCPDPDMLLCELLLNADWDQNAYPQFHIPVGGFFDDVEAGAGNWTHYVVTATFTDQWHRSTQRQYSGEYSWKFGDTGAGNYADLSDGALESESLPIPLRPICTLTFRHWMEAEVSGAHAGYCYDGGMVEMSLNGAAWEQIFPVGGYNYLIREGGTPGPWPAETEVYSGNIDWAEAVFDVSGYEGEARFRFRFGSDGAETAEGWYIDDIEFTGYGHDPADAGETVSVVLHPVIDQNIPNPFNPTTAIAYRLPASSDVLLRVFDPAGRLVRTLVDGRQEAGSHHIAWNGMNDAGIAVGSGVYFYRFEVEGVAENRKMILTR